MATIERAKSMPVVTSQDTIPRTQLCDPTPLEGNVTKAEVSLLRQAIMRGAQFLGLSDDSTKTGVNTGLNASSPSADSEGTTTEELPSHSTDSSVYTRAMRSLSAAFSPLYAVATATLSACRTIIMEVVGLFRSPNTAKKEASLAAFALSDTASTSAQPSPHSTSIHSPTILDVIESKPLNQQELLANVLQQAVEACRREEKEEQTERQEEIQRQQHQLDDARRLILEIDHRCGSNPNNPAVAQILASLNGASYNPIERLEHVIERAIREVQALQLQELREEDISKKRDS